MHALNAAVVTLGIIIVLVIAAAATGVQSQCNFETRLVFKPKGAVSGLPSYINQKEEPGAEPVYFENPLGATARPLPPVIVEAVQGTTRELDMTKDGSLVVCTSEPPLRMGGSSVELNRGEALFDSLTILEQIQPNRIYNLVFTMTSADGTVYTLRSPLLIMVNRDDTKAFSMRFRNSGYFTRPGSPRQVPVNVSIPPFWIEFVGRTGYTVPASNKNVKVRATIPASEEAGGTTTPAMNGGSFRPTDTFTGAESVEFSGLTYIAPAAGSPQSVLVSTSGVVFEFSVTCLCGSACCAVPMDKIENRVSVVQEIARNRFMQFDPVRSYIRYDNEGGTAVLDVPMPAIIMQLQTSQMGIDASNTGIVIQALSEQGKLDGAEALVIRGRAVFENLKFVDFVPRSAVITFSTSLPDPSGQPRPAKLYSGAIFVTKSAIKASRLRFDDKSPITDNSIVAAAYSIPGALVGGNIEFTLPLTRVLFVDSANRYDLTAHKIRLRLEIDSGAYIMTPIGGAATVEKESDWGTVTWDQVRFRTNMPSNRTFTVRIFDPLGIRSPPLSSAKYRLLDTGALSVSGSVGACIGNSPYCPLRLRFASEFGGRSSAVYEEDISVYTTVGSAMPKIVLSIEDWFGAVGIRATDLTAANAPTVRAYTGADPQQESILDSTELFSADSTTDTRLAANDGRFQNGYYIFECLTIKQPTGLVRLNFVALDRTSFTYYEGMGRPRTGFTTVLASPISGYAVEFAPSSLLQFNGQRTSAVLGVAMSPVVFRVMDSQNKHDTADSSVVVAATASTDDTTLPVTAQKGFVNFTLLQFRVASEEPTWTFTVVKSSNTAGGQKLQTGKLRLTTIPIPLYEVVFDDTRGTTSKVTSNFQSIIVGASWGTSLDVVLIVRDSAHEVSRDLQGYTITVSVSSDDGDLAPQTASFNAATGKAAISTVLRGVRPGVPAGGPIHVRYRIVAGPAILIGQSLIVGPIQLAGADAQCGGGGGGGGGTSAVVAEFVAPLPEFLRTKLEVERKIAGALGVETQRVNITEAKQVTRIGHTDLKPYLVSKARIAFQDPLPTSTIRKSRSDLAAEFLQVRPSCDLPELKLWNVYPISQDRDCIVPEFNKGLSEANNCTTSGKAGRCECFENGVVRDFGTQCAEVPELLDTLVLMCNEVRASCPQSGIQTLCANVLVSKRSSMVWAYATLGGVALCSILGYVYYKRRQLKKREVLTLTGGAA